MPILTIWNLWIERNNRKHRNSCRTPDILCMHILEDLKNLARANPFSGRQIQKDDDLLSSLKKEPRKKKLQAVSWTSPPEGKLNVDGSLTGVKGGGGGLLRDHDGKVLWCFGLPCNNKAIDCIELSALIKGLEYCRFHNFMQVSIETDSLVVSRWLSSKSIRWDVWHDICWAQHLIKETGSKITHIWRERNNAADYLAKLAKDT